MGVPWWLSGLGNQGTGVVTAVAWVRSLAGELLHAAGVAKKKKKKLFMDPDLEHYFSEKMF